MCHIPSPNLHTLEKNINAKFNREMDTGPTYIVQRIGQKKNKNLVKLSGKKHVKILLARMENV